MKQLFRRKTVRARISGNPLVSVLQQYIGFLEGRGACGDRRQHGALQRTDTRAPRVLKRRAERPAGSEHGRSPHPTKHPQGRCLPKRYKASLTRDCHGQS